MKSSVNIGQIDYPEHKEIARYENGDAKKMVIGVGNGQFTGIYGIEIRVLRVSGGERVLKSSRRIFELRRAEGLAKVGRAIGRVKP